MYTKLNRETWYFDVDDTLIMWDRSKYRDKPVDWVTLETSKGPVELVVNQKNVNLLIKLAKLGYYIRVYSGSGADWAEKIVTGLGLQQYVDSIETKPKGITDDKAPGDGTAYLAWRDPVTGAE